MAFNTWALLVAAVIVVVGALACRAHGRRMRKWRRKWLEWRLRAAEDRAAKLRLALSCMKVEDKPVRIFMDGVFDLCHFGHMNAFRQGRLLGTQLVVGVNSGVSVKREKGSAPVLSDDERNSVVRSCRFVDETIPSSPYTMDREYLRKLVSEYNIDFIAHGDDPCVGPDGADVYADAKQMGMFKVIPRTEGVSTTDILGRTLLLTTQHHCSTPYGPTRLSSLPRPIELPGLSQKGQDLLKVFAVVRRPTHGEKVVYVDGSFDLFHAGHVSVLEQAGAFGDYLLVGLHSDREVKAQKGGMYPIMNLEERLLALLACRHVDDVLVNAPWSATLDLVRTEGVNIVCCGKDGDRGLKTQEDPYVEIRDRGLLREVDSGSDLTVDVVLKRLEPAREELQKRYMRKSEAEATFWRNKNVVVR